MIDAYISRFGFHLHIGHQIVPWFMLWCLWHQDCGVAIGRREFALKLP